MKKSRFHQVAIVFLFALQLLVPAVEATGPPPAVVRDRRENNDNNNNNNPNKNRPLPPLPTDDDEDGGDGKQKANNPPLPVDNNPNKNRPLPPVHHDDDDDAGNDGKQKLVNPNPPQKPVQKLNDANQKPKTNVVLKDANKQPIKTPPKTPPPPVPEQNYLKVYQSKLVDRFDPNTKPNVKYEGAIIFDGHGIPRLAEDGKLNGRLVGKFLGGGSNSKVFTSSNIGLVKKFVSLMVPGRSRTDVAATITDQNGGRKILQDIKRRYPDSPFRVAKLEDQSVVSAVDPNTKKEYRFVMNREENISSPITKRNGTQIHDSAGNPRNATNALERTYYRNEPLNDSESMTLSLVVRDLNDAGIVWTDNKLQNFDIVRDPESKTGYRVIFFDFDGFRPVKGNNPQVRAEAAHDIQRAFDNPALDNNRKWQRKPGEEGIQQVIETDELLDNGWTMAEARVTAAYRKHYPSVVEPLIQSGQPVSLELAFDKTAFDNDPNVQTIATPLANDDMGKYLLLSSLPPDLFQQEIDRFNATTKRNAVYNPRNPLTKEVADIMRE